MCCGGSSKSSNTSGSTKCPQWPDKCCLCLSKRGGTVAAGLVSVLTNICLILPCVYALVSFEFWAKGYNVVQNWVVDNHWDAEITQSALDILTKISSQRRIYLIILIAYCGMHVLNSLVLIAGVLCQKRLLLLPWLIQDMVTIILMGICFVAWAFLSFFVHILVAIFFPVVSGAILGLWIYMWRNTRDLFQIYGIDVTQHGGTIYRKLPAGTRQLSAV